MTWHTPHTVTILPHSSRSVPSSSPNLLSIIRNSPLGLPCFVFAYAFIPALTICPTKISLRDPHPCHSPSFNSLHYYSLYQLMLTSQVPPRVFNLFLSLPSSSLSWLFDLASVLPSLTLLIPLAAPLFYTSPATLFLHTKSRSLAPEFPIVPSTVSPLVFPLMHLPPFKNTPSLQISNKREELSRVTLTLLSFPFSFTKNIPISETKLPFVLFVTSCK